jgi:hypothetical protein
MRDFTAEDKAQRARLEKQASVGDRANVVGNINRVSVDDTLFQRSAVAVLTRFPAGAQGRRRTVGEMNARHDAYLAKSERLDRLHPSSQLARAEASFRPQPSQDPDREGDDPASRERFVTPLREGETYDRVMDADGSMDADARTRASHFAGQGVKDLSLADMKERLILSLEQMRALSFAKLASSRYW